MAATALSALEQTLWDLQSKSAGVPVYSLFGGALRTDIRTYANINRTVVERTPKSFVEIAMRAVDDGFDAIKLAPFDGMRRSATTLPMSRNGQSPVLPVRKRFAKRSVPDVIC